MFCGMPLYNHRWHKARERSFWIPLDEFPNIPSARPQLELVNMTDTNGGSAAVKRFNFKLNGPDHMTLFIGLKENTQILNWSFNDTMLVEKWEAPYFIYFSYGKFSDALEFFVDVEVSRGQVLPLNIYLLMSFICAETYWNLCYT